MSASPIPASTQMGSNETAPLQISPPGTWKELAGKWGLPLVSLCGYAYFCCGTLALPGMAYTKGREGAQVAASLIAEGAVVVGSATLVATAVKVADAAKTAWFHGGKAAKDTLSQAFRIGGFVRRTFLPPVGHLITEVMDVVRRKQGLDVDRLLGRLIVDTPDGESGHFIQGSRSAP